MSKTVGSAEKGGHIMTTYYATYECERSGKRRADLSYSKYY